MTFNPVSVKSYGAAGAYSIFCKKVTAALLPNSASASEISNERIRQTLTSAFENSGLELTFRQACTAEKTGEVEFLDVNHCVTIEDGTIEDDHLIDAQINIQNMILPHVK